METQILKTVWGSFCKLHLQYWFQIHGLKCMVRVPDVKVPSVVFIVGDVNPVVVGDHPLVQGQNRLVPRLDPSHL